MSLLLLIEEAQGLFHHAIPQSGHALSLGLIQNKDDIRKRHREILEKMGEYA